MEPRNLGQDRELFHRGIDITLGLRGHLAIRGRPRGLLESLLPSAGSHDSDIALATRTSARSTTLRAASGVRRFIMRASSG